MNTMRAALLIAVTVPFLALAGQAAGQENPGLTGRLADTLDAFRHLYGFPGATAAVALPDRTIAAAATEFADVEARRAMAPGTRMLAASIGKTFLSATVLALESEGRLSRADLLADHLGDRPWFAELPNADTITLGHLLRHQSGLPDHPHLPEFLEAAGARIAAGERAFTP